MVITRKNIKTWKMENPKGGEGELTVFSYLPAPLECTKLEKLYMIDLAEGSTLGNHTHSDRRFEGFLVVEGEGVFGDNGTEVPVKKGDFLFTDEGEYHFLTNTGRCSMKLVAVICQRD